MQIEARFRRRAEAAESVIDLNDRVLRGLSGIEGLWKDGRPISDTYFDAGGGESAATDLSPCLAFGIRGAISYASRLPTAIVDKARSDDSLILQLDTDAVDFDFFCRDTFPKIVKILGAYRAAVITDLDQDLDDFEDIVKEAQGTGKDIDGRDTVFRIYPVNYFDNTICFRAFGISASEVVARLAGTIVLADGFQSGALLMVSNEPVIGERLIAIDAQIRQKLQESKGPE